MTTGQLSLFQPIDQPHISWNRWAVSLIAHVVFIAVVISIPVAVTRVIEPAPRFTETHLVAPVIPPQPVKVEAPKPVFERKPKPIEVKKFKAPPPPKVEPPKPIEAKIEPPKIIAPKPIEPPKVEMVRVPEPKFDTPAPTPPRPSVKTDVFAVNVPAPTGPKASHDVRLGGFGNPDGVPVSTASTGKGVVAPRIGSFDLPAGSGVGGGGGKAAVVASAGFGNAGFNGAPGGNSASSNHAVVRPAGFSDYQTAQTGPRVVKPSTPAETPVEILFKPKPVYTPLAREKRIEGEVQLDVVFTATGQIHVMGVVRGLGCGLDESARTAASQIRFRPGTRDGNPVDMRGIVHIVFELS